MDEPENLTVCLLQEMRAEIRDLRTEVHAMRDDLGSRIDDLTNRVDGNNLILNMLAGLVSNHEDRLSTIETR